MPDKTFITIIVLCVLITALIALQVWTAIEVKNTKSCKSCNKAEQEKATLLNNEKNYEPFETNLIYDNDTVTFNDSAVSCITSQLFVPLYYESQNNDITIGPTVRFYSDVLDHNAKNASNISHEKQTTAELMVICPYHFSSELIQDRLSNRSPNTFVMIYNGEPNDFYLNSSDITLSISTQRDIPADLKEKNVFLPYFAMFLKEFGRVTGALHAKTKRYIDLNQWKKRQFCFYGHGNSSSVNYTGVSDRGRFYRYMVERFGNSVRNVGRTDHAVYERPQDWRQIKSSQYANNYRIGTNVYMLQSFQFSIAFENSQLRGYITEKIIEPLEANCIPIYCGAPDVDEWINPNCFINVNNYPDWKSLCDDIASLVDDDVRLLAILQAPCFTNKMHNSKVNSYLRGKGEFYRNCYDIMPKSIKNHMWICKNFNQRIHAVTFADGNYCQSTRIQEEMKNCGYFDTFVSVNGNEIVDYFASSKNHAWKSQNSQKGYGWYAWKSLIVYKALKDLNDNDLLIWLDAGMHIKPSMGSKVHEYYSKLIDSEKDVMPFRIKYTEAAFNKRDTVEEVIRRYPENAREILASDIYQFCTGAFIIKKTKSSLKLVKDWHEISIDKELHFSNDNPSTSGPESTEFIDHRHDQSIFSLLCKLGPANIIVNNDNFADDETSDLTVFQPRRWRTKKV